ncbi:MULTISPECIES: tyrosine-type recombinase/integrase [Pectobacterium]|uniref:tyrosine-type recombinase/integrase n=1 Tax=Pectobacterium TaxID=122277 RepID=UPI000CDE8C15|nr:MULTISPECIES: site-specific integrase [Pectobacterium]MCA6962462.1 integrase arm-type DNA-binding domain-containing protein [Pectobacterium odoriferum]MCH5010558.1 integrase arm-type DNA-binding domain-containing protein [Pectobacterium odoriferum]POY57385.1 integrase [Pectobacterium versatile]POY61541.1 integrase [Pectobacterium versatile]
MAGILLTDSKIKGIKPKESAYYVWQAAATRGTGRLGIKVYPSGRKVFVYKYHKNGARKFLSLGDYPHLSLADATAKALVAAANVSEPELAAFEHATVQQLFDDYIADQKRLERRAYDKTENRLKQVLATGFISPSLPAKDVTPDQIKRVLADFIKRGALAGANKIRTNLHAVFNFGLFADNDPANINGKVKYGLDRNPVAVVPAQKGADKALDRFLSWDELAQLLRLLNVTDIACPINPDFSRLALLCLYTGGQRPWEVMTNTRDNWDKKGKTLTVPPHISKNGDYHVIALSPSAITILEEQERLYPDSEFIFPAATKEGHLLSAEFSKQLRKFCAKTEFSAFTPRDIRRTFKTLAGDMGISSELRDIVQNHKRPGVSRKHYDRYDYLKEKREVIALWEGKLNSL